MKRARVAVPVATVWTDPQSVRNVDAPALQRYPDITSWLSSMTEEENIALCSEKRLQTQVLFGDEVLVDQLRGEWAYVFVPSQPSVKNPLGYPGWIASAHIKNWVPLTHCTEKVMVHRKFASLSTLSEEPDLDLSYGTFLDLLDEDGAVVKVDGPIGAGFLDRGAVIFPSREPRSSGKDILKNALCFLNLPYLWSGMSAYGYDCSGFSFSMLRAGGYQIPRDACDQLCCGKEVGTDSMKPGDLLFFAYKRGTGKVHHVGICAGAGRMVHSPTPGEKVSLTELAGTKFEEELCAVRRYWESE
ncbi:NlpC/P60 family protein [Sporolactobacillus shoreae]|uniref:NlpC/P60 family protein n=1 Tax=Sporolactobacillus shoreae TaxID=1465501 RepID=A0A4Z0GVX6_9BACL|nr:C40 family peptidase [Sporolactobacillus shoreae]TGB00442.1 NlpC/P60 family protein [Sporolactobacillus shoreae]